MGGGRQGRGAQYARCGGAESGLMRGSRQGRRGGGHGDSATARAQILDISWKSTGTCSEFRDGASPRLFSRPGFSQDDDVSGSGKGKPQASRVLKTGHFPV